jgi:hypothetical protein
MLRLGTWLRRPGWAAARRITGTWYLSERLGRRHPVRDAGTGHGEGGVDFTLACMGDAFAVLTLLPILLPSTNCRVLRLVYIELHGVVVVKGGSGEAHSSPKFGGRFG